MGGKKPSKKAIRDGIKDGIKKEVFGGQNPSLQHSTVTGSNNHFVVDDENGRKLLEADVTKVEGIIGSGSMGQGPVKFFNSRCKLYEKGKHSMDLQSAEATWDGERLVTSTPAHGVTADGKTIVDGQRAAWTSKTGLLVLETARMQGLKNGKIDFTAEGPHAEVLNRVVTMDRGGKGRNAEGQQLTGRKILWNMDTSRLDAEGNVELLDAGTRVTGQRLRSDTKLKRGRISGGTRTELKKIVAAPR